jgi:sulfide dehydrogenase cytochrome subunit
MKMTACILLLGCLTVSTGAASAADIGAITQSCNDCHGNDGISQWTDVPTIAGMPAVNQEDALYYYAQKQRPCPESKYRQGDTSRPATTMCAVAAELSEALQTEVAGHYASLKFVPAKQAFDAKLAAAGEAVHKSECDRCHTNGGSNPDDEASILAGQWLGYLQSSFEEYASGKREQSDKMKEKMDTLSADDVTALLNYYASQQ